VAVDDGGFAGVAGRNQIRARRQHCGRGDQHYVLHRLKGNLFTPSQLQPHLDPAAGQGHGSAVTCSVFSNSAPGSTYLHILKY
jgi:hypothetical protein